MTGIANNIYQALDASRQEIRLIDLQPSAAFADPIVCTLRTVSLLDNVQYEALSWCWGTNSEKETVVMNGIDMTCPKHLSVALRYLRDAQSPITLWIDAFCIKQDDPVEKQTQIPLMREVYGHAAVVKIWLGDPTPDSQEAIDLLNELLGGQSLWRKINGKYISAKQCDQLEALVSRPWWSRTWTAQEFVLAKHATYHCGYATFDSVRLLDWAQRELQEVRNTEEEFWEYLVKEGFDITNMWSSLKQMFHFTELKDLLHDTSGLSSWLAVRTMCEVSILKATDQRDKIFGMLGLLNPGYSDVWKRVPNWYELKVEFVYAIQTFTTMRFTESLHILSFIPKRSPSDVQALVKCLFDIEREKMSLESREKLSILPSWSVDFSQTSGKAESLNAWFKCTAEVDFDRNNSIIWSPPFLTVQGIPFDEIVTCHAVDPDLEPLQRNFRKLDLARPLHDRWRQFLGIGRKDGTAHRAYIGGGSMDDAYWRTVVAGMCCKLDWEKRRMDPASIKSYVNWIRQKDDKIIRASWWTKAGHGPAETYEESMGWWLRSISSPVSNAFFFTTRRGYMGLSVGRSPIAVGDRIYLLAHARVPFILRPCHHPDREVFVVICECYVDGIMDGEAMREPPLPTSKEVRRNELRRSLFGGATSDPVLPLTEWQSVTLI